MRKGRSVPAQPTTTARRLDTLPRRRLGDGICSMYLTCACMPLLSFAPGSHAHLALPLAVRGGVNGDSNGITLRAVHAGARGCTRVPCPSDARWCPLCFTRVPLCFTRVPLCFTRVPPLLHAGAPSGARGSPLCRTRVPPLMHAGAPSVCSRTGGHPNQSGNWCLRCSCRRRRRNERRSSRGNE